MIAPGTSPPSDPTESSDPTEPGSLSRRHLLLAAGAGLVVGAGGAETGNLLRPSPSPSRAVAPGETLMYEHGVLKRVLLIYENAVQRAAGNPALAATAIHGGAQIIHTFIESFHEGLEEGYVFPVLRAAGQDVPTVETLLLQHARGRLLTQFLLGAATADTLATAEGRQPVTDAVAAFVRMYQPHEAREDTVIFPAFRAVSTPGELDRYGETFTRLQTQQFGSDGFAATVAGVAAIEVSLGIYDLAQFTPAAISPTPPNT